MPEINNPNPVPPLPSSNPIETLSGEKSTHQLRTPFVIIIGLLVCLVIAVAGYYFYTQYAVPTSNTNLAPVVVTNTATTTPEIVRSNYGFSFTISEGWHVWEGQSAFSELIMYYVNSTDFAPLEDSKPLVTETLQNPVYQEFMDRWNIASSTSIELTNAEVDYKDRDLANAAKYSSTLIDSTDILGLGATQIMISGMEVDLGKAIINNDKRESRNINVNGTEARFDLAKNYKLVDWMFINLPIDSNKYIDGKNVQSLMFNRYVKKGDPNALQDLITFISALNITKNT